MMLCTCVALDTAAFDEHVAYICLPCLSRSVCPARALVFMRSCAPVQLVTLAQRVAPRNATDVRMSLLGKQTQQDTEIVKIKAGALSGNL